MVSRRRAALSGALATAFLLAACTSGSSADGTGEGSASATSSPLPTASATVTPTPTATPTPTTSGPSVGQVISPDLMGLHVSGVQEGQWPDSNVPFGALRLWDAGTNWSQVESVRGKYDWRALDAALTTAEDNGVDDVLLVLGSTPTWNASRIKVGDYPVPGAASAPKDEDAWDAFVTAVVKRYKGRIDYYQIWNEASLAMFWNGTPEKLAELTKRAADIIHRDDPKAGVVAASTTVRLEGAFKRFFPKYLEALAAQDWPVDVFSAHLYPAALDGPDTRSAFITQVQGALSDAGAPDLPLWDTELNYGLAGPGPSNPKQTITGGKARDWVVRTALDSLRQGVARAYWYIWTPAPYALLGMQFTNDSGAVKGLRVVAQWLVGGTWGGCTTQGDAVTCKVTKDGVPSVIAWAPGGAGSVETPDGFSQVCTTANECEDANGTVELTATPVRFTS